MHHPLYKHHTYMRSDTHPSILTLTILSSILILTLTLGTLGTLGTIGMYIRLRFVAMRH